MYPILTIVVPVGGHMEPNVGGLDRTARIIVGPIVAIIGILILIGEVALNPIVGGGLLVVGAVLLATGLTRRCILNRVFGVNTASKR